MGTSLPVHRFSTQCYGTTHTNVSNNTARGTDHAHCDKPETCICRCHDDPLRGKMTKTQREDTLWEYSVTCHDCPEHGEFIHNGMAVHAARFLNDQGWINLRGSTQGSTKGTWICPSCAIERLETIDLTVGV